MTCDHHTIDRGIKQGLAACIPAMWCAKDIPSNDPMMLVALSRESALADMSAALLPAAAKCCVSAACVAPDAMPTMALATLARDTSTMKQDPGRRGEARSNAIAADVHNT